MHIEEIPVHIEEIPSLEASTLQSGSVAFPPGQCTSPQLHPCHRLFDQDGHQDTSHPPYRPDLAPCDFWSFPKLTGCRYETIEEMKEAVTKVIDTLTQEDFHGSSRSCWNGTASALKPEEITLKGTRVSCVLSIKVPIQKSLETYLMILVYIYIYIYISNIQLASKDYGCGISVYRIYEGFHINLW